MNEITLVNRGESFVLSFNGNEYKIPEGKFTSSNDLANFILFTAKKWKKDVVKESQIKSEPVKVEDKVEETKEEVQVEEVEEADEVEEVEPVEEEVIEPKKNKKK